MTKEQLQEKHDGLSKSLENLLQQQAQIAEQVTMHRGALQYNQMLMKEVDDAAAEAAKPTLKAVEDLK